MEWGSGRTLLCSCIPLDEPKSPSADSTQTVTGSRYGAPGERGLAARGRHSDPPWCLPVLSCCSVCVQQVLGEQHLLIRGDYAEPNDGTLDTGVGITRIGAPTQHWHPQKPYPAPQEGLLAPKGLQLAVTDRG